MSDFANDSPPMIDARTAHQWRELAKDENCPQRDIINALLDDRAARMDLHRWERREMNRLECEVDELCKEVMTMRKAQSP